MNRRRITPTRALSSSMGPARLSMWGIRTSWLILLSNLLFFRQPDGELPTPAPRVSILVPARNEAHAIERCVRSLLAQAYPDFELLVLDDHSTDATPAILEGLRRASEEQRTGTDLGEAIRLRTVPARPLPPGWAGKNWACWQLAQAADPRSRYLLFTDADTVHAPDALRRSVAEAERHHLHLLSLMPEQQMESWAEQAIVGLLSHQILAYLPLWGMAWLPIPRIAVANGQYLLIERDSYWRAGGHQSVAQRLSEDVEIARRVKGQRDRVRLLNGAGLVRCRMYRSANEVVSGFRRSFASGFRLDGGLAAFVIVWNAVAFIWPFLRLNQASGLVQATAVLAERWLLARLTNSPARTALWHPLGMVLLLGVQILAAWDAVTGRRSTWKGRAYHETGSEVG